MGVRGVQTFLERDVPGGCTHVNIIQEAQNYRKYCPHGTKPTIVVDGLSMLGWIFSGTNEFILGGPWNFLVHRITKDFVERFQSHGIDLVFLFDGCISSTKVEVWKERRRRHTKEIWQVFGKLHAGEWTGNFVAPNGSGRTLALAIRSLTPCKVLYTVEECDLEIARYAEEHQECFALLSQDSDYVIFDSRVLYLSILHLNTRAMSTCAYHSHAMAQHLGLVPRQLALLSCLAGNDIVIANRHLRQFHASLGFPAGRGGGSAAKFQQLANLIKDEGWTGEPDEAVAARTRVDLKLLQEGTQSYNLHSEPLVLPAPPHVDRHSWAVALEFCTQGVCFPFILQVLYTKECFLGECIEQIW